MANQNTSHIQDSHDQLESILSKIDDLENRSRHFNFCIRDIPKSIKYILYILQSDPLSKISYQISQNTISNTSELTGPYNLHSQMAIHKTVVKPHFYAVKEDIMRLSRKAEQLTIQGHPIQVFADLSPTIIQTVVLKAFTDGPDRKWLNIGGLSPFIWSSTTIITRMVFHSFLRANIYFSSWVSSPKNRSYGSSKCPPPTSPLTLL